MNPHALTNTYSTKLISLNCLWFTSTKTSLVNQVREFLLHQFLDLLDRLLKARLARARNVEVKRRVLLLISKFYQKQTIDLQQP